MTNEELITGLRHIAHTMERNGHSYYQHVAEDAIKALEQRWIPVSERLPEDGQSVLFCDIYNDIMLGYHIKGRPNTHFSQDGTFGDTKNVIAWMPLPEPYEEGEADDE